MANVVVGALVIAKRDDGSDLYLYQGSEVPASVAAADVKRFIALGLVSKADAGSAPSAQSN